MKQRTDACAKEDKYKYDKERIETLKMANDKRPTPFLFEQTSEGCTSKYPEMPANFHSFEKFENLIGPLLEGVEIR